MIAKNNEKVVFSEQISGLSKSQKFTELDTVSLFIGMVRQKSTEE